MCINGKRPKQLAGANDSTVTVSPTSTGNSIHECAQVGQDVIDQTRSQLEEDWKRIDEWIAKDKEYRERRPAMNK
jgi:hypothetical protein